MILSGSDVGFSKDFKIAIINILKKFKKTMLKRNYHDDISTNKEPQ